MVRIIYLFSKYILQEVNLRVRFSNFIAIDNCENMKKKIFGNTIDFIE